MKTEHPTQKDTREIWSKKKDGKSDRDESRLVKLYEQAPIGIVECALDGKYLNVNEEFCRITGYTREEIRALDIHYLTHPADLAREKDVYQELVSGSLPFYNIEERYVRKNRAVIWVGIVRSLVRDDHGTPLYSIGIVQDITHRKSVQEILRKSEAALQKKNIELEKLVQEGIADLNVANLALVEGQKSIEILSRRLIGAQENERRTIARELHDGVSQSLSALKLNLVLISDELLAISQQETSARLTESIDLSAQLIDLVRNVMTDLRPSGLDEQGLEDALLSLIEQFRSRHSLNIRFERSDPPVPRLEPALELTLLRIAQEALFNIVRHAGTREAALVLRPQEEAVYLAVEDQGAGIESLGRARRSGNHGMTIMRERAEAFGGNFEVTSIPGQGTKIEVTVPMKAGSGEKEEKKDK
jgi:two-component system sensor histidine kinase UhpB